MLLCLMWSPLAAATATWDGGGGDGMWSNPLNWSTDAVPGAADDAVLSGPGPIGITAAVTVRDLTLDTGFTGTVAAAAPVTVTRACRILGGTWSAGAQTLSVGSDLVIADLAGAFVAGTGTVALTGTGQLSNPNPGNPFHHLVTAPSGHTTRVMSSITTTRLLTIGGGLCDVRQNAAVRQIHLRGSGAVLERQGSGSLQGWWPNGCELWFESDGSAPMELPGMDYGQCAVRLLALGESSAEFSQMGPMTNVHYLTTATESIHRRLTWSTNSHPVSVTVFLATGYQGSGGGTTWNVGASVVNTGANFCWFTSSSDVINLGNAQITAASMAAWSGSSQINPGTSTATLTGGSIGVPWITRQLPFWNLVLAGSAATTVTPHGDLLVGHDLTIAGGTLASAARAVTVQGSLVVGEAGRLAVTTGTVRVGADLSLPAVAGAFTAGTGSVVLTGTGTLSAPGQAFHDLTTAPSGRSTRPLSDLLITRRLTVGGGLLDLRQNAAVRQVHLRGSGQMLVVQPGGSIQGWFPNGGELCFEATGAAPMDLPGLDYGQCGIRLRTQGAVIGTFNQSGAIRNAHFLTTSADHVGGRTVWNTNGHDVALTVYLLTGTDGSMGGTTWNAGASRIEAGSNFCWFTHASDVINLQDCRLSAGGFATWVPQVQVDPGTSTVAVRGGVGVPWWPHLHRLANLQLTGSGPGYLHGPVQCSGDVAIGSGGLQAGGELILDGAAPSTLDVAGPGVLAALRIAKPAGLQVSSALALQSLVVDPGSTVQWAAGRTVTTQALQLLGTAEQPIALASTQSGSPWLLNAAAPSPTAWVRVSDSDARAGATIDATDHGVDLGSNQNWRFTIQHVAQPTISLASGTYQAAQNVTLSCATPSVVFRFSLDGSDPALSPLTTTESVLVSASATLRVVAERSGWQTSPEASATYVLQVQPVTASLPAGSHVGPQAVTLGCPTPGTTIVYTLDGTDPASSSTVAIATGPVQLPGSCTLRAIATLAGWSASAQFQAAYALQVAMPTITPAGGAVAAGTSVVISADAGILRYTTDGSDPAASATSQEAASPVSLPITAAMTVRAIGRTAGWTDSAEVSAAFSIQGDGGGDPEPPTAEVALAVVPADLTGQKFWNGLQLTNLPTVRFTVQATRVTSGWSVARLGVDSQGGSWSGASPVAADLPEGQQTVVAWAEVSKDGLTHRIVGQGLDLLVDRSEPVITLLEPGHTDGTKTLDAGLLSAGGRPLLLNRAADASALREIAGWRSWSVDGLDIPVLVEDVSGVDPDTAPTASIGSSALTVQLATPSTGGRDILHLTRFDAVPDAVTVDPATLVLLAGAGMQLLEVAVVDRCGNAATATMCSVWKKTTAGGAAFGYVPHQVGGFPASIGILDAQRHSSLAPVALLATPSDIVAVDQYAVAVNGVVTSLGSAMRLTQGTDWAGLPGQGPALWQLRPVAADSLGNMRSAVVIRDATGNTLGTPSTPFPIITAWRPTRATAPEASTTLLQTEVELQTDRIEMRTLWSGWQLQGQWIGWLSRDTYLGYGWPTGIWVNYPVLTYSLAHVGRVGSTRSTQAPIPWEIEQPTEGAKLMVEMEGAASTLLTKVVAGVPESVHYGTITATHPGITGDAITYEGKLPLRIQDGPSNAVVEVVTAKPAPFTRDEARFVGIGPWDTHVYAQVQHERRVLDLQSGVLAWNTILDRPTQGPLVAAVPPSWSTAPVIVRYAPLADAGRLVVADANLPPITVSADAGGHLEIPMDRSLPGGFARVQRRKTAADGAQSWQHLGFRGMDLVKILGDVLATGQQTLRLEGGFQSQLSAKLPALSPMGGIRIIASTRRSWSEARLAGLAPRAAGNLDVIGTWLDAIASDAQADMSGADAVAAGAASRQLAISLLMRQRELQSGMNAATRGVSASALQAQYQAQTVAIANDTIRELWNQALPPDAVAQRLAVLSSAEMAAEAALAAATLAAVDQPATAAYALAARQAFQRRLDAARTWIATQRMMIAGWDSYRDAVRRGVEAYRQRLAPHEQFLDGMVSAYNSYFSSNLVEPPASGWASGPMYVSTDYPGFDLEGWNQAQAAIQAIQAEEMFTAYNVASAQCENRIFHENLEHAAAAIAGAFADRTGSAGDVLAPRLFVVGQPAPEDIDPAVAIRQRYGVSMLIGEEAAGLYDVDVNIGAVHAYPDELSQQYAGANGAHRMKEALAVVKLAVKDVEVGQMESKKIEDFITFEAPHLSENEIENLMKGWTIEWPSGGNAYLLENDPSAFKKLTSIKPLMITESKGVQDVYVLGGNVIHDELDAEPQPYTGQFYIRTDNLTATMGISGVLGNITVTPAVAQIQTVYDAQKTFIAAPKGLPSLLGRPGIVSFRDAQWDFDLMPGNPGTDGTGRNTKFVVRFDGNVQSDLNKPCVRITKWDDGRSFHVTGDYPGTGILQVRPLFGEEEGDVICEIPIPVEIPVISEPSMLQLDTAKARAETRRNSNDENLVEAPTPLAADENDNPLLEMPKSTSTAYPFGQVDAPTASVRRLDGIYEHAMFVAGQILPITADGWTEPFDVEKNSDAAFTFPSVSNDYELSLALLCSLLTDGSSTSPAPVQSKLALSPVADIWRRYQKRIKQQTDKDLEPRDAQDVLAQEKRAIELRGKTLVQLAAAARLKRFFSLSVDGEDKPTVQGLANWSYPSGPLGKHLPMMGESGGNIIYISDVDDLKSALGNWMGSVGLPKLFQNSPAAIDWKYGHPLTEDLITHMVGERMDFTKTAMEIVGADWSAHLTPIWYDDVVPNELMNAKVHYFMDADGWVKLRMIGASGQSLNWTLCPSQEGYPQGYYTYQGTTYRLLRVRADSPIGLGVGLAQDEIYRLLMAYNHRAYADYWTSFGNNSPTGLFAFVIGDTLFGITDIFQAYTGTDLVTGENLSNGQRAYSAAMVLLMVVPADTLVLKGVTKLLRSGKSALSATSKAIYENVSKSAAGSEAARGAKAMADAAEDQIATQGAKQTPTGTPSAGDGLGSAARRPGGFVAMGWQGVRQVFRGTYSISDLFNLHAGCAALTNHVVVAKGATSPLAGMFRSLAVAGKRVAASPISLRYLPRTAREMIDNFASQQQFIDEMIEAYGRDEGMKKLERLRQIACFTGDTNVLMADGARRSIAQIRVGDLVATRCQYDASASMAAGRVTEVFRHETTELRVIRAVRQTENGLLSVVIRTTDEHPFWRITSGWVVAADLHSGDRVASTDGYLTVMDVEREYTDPLYVYNLQIDGGSTYFVGGAEMGGDVWVHNICRQQTVLHRYLLANPQLLGGRKAAKVAYEAMEKMSKGESLGIPGVIIPGDGAKLRASIKARLSGSGFTEPSWFMHADAHHLIPSEVVGRDGIKDLLARIGFDTNRFANGIMLPAKEGILGVSKRSVHNGGHEQYRNAVADALRVVADDAAVHGDKWAIGKIIDIQKAIRKNLRNGVPLDPTDALPADALGSKWRGILLDVIQ